MKKISSDAIAEAVRELAISAAHDLEPDILEALVAARDRETSSLSKNVLELLIMNADIASREQIPACQDTGICTVFVNLGQDVQVEGDMEKEMKKITSGAYKRAQEIKGEADAEATLIYARAFGKDPEFYSFIQTLDIYKETMDKKSSLVLSTDSEFLKYFKGYKGNE